MRRLEHFGHRAGRSSSREGTSLRLLPTLQAGEGPVRAVELDDVSAPCSLVEAIYILGDDGGEEAHLFQFGQPVMGRVWFCGQDEGEHLLQHEPDLFGILLEGIDMGVFLGSYFSQRP